MTEHYHIFSIASSKVFIGVIGLCIVCLFCLFTIFYQRKEIIIYKDNDLKYRYVQMYGYVTTEDFAFLDSIFHFNQNSEKIQELCESVETFEENIKQRAKIIEQEERLKVEKERLEKESNTSRKLK